MQIFLDMAVLVEAQGDLLDNIESQVHTILKHECSMKMRWNVNPWTTYLVGKSCNYLSQVSGAVDHVHQGNTALQKAKSLQKNSRKWMCIAIIILLIIVVIIVVAVLKPWSSNKGA